jgi:hypothetical protein
VCRHRLRHLRIQRGKHLSCLLDQRNRQATGVEILGHLQPDEPSADHHGGTGMLGFPDNGVGVDDVP